ncbi:hypothetical protein [Ralstonia phage RP31]|uniref:Uncharacterized protein n=1 Tax=Ralstonia phage RP31 TaxID=1923890 RepID=A0A1L7N1C9_9CAUD|nr:hypothetical protein [Ralstonia phage RP31]
MEQNQAQVAERGNIKLYACGGAGINIGSNFEGFRGHIEAGMAEVDVVYFDTSRSNLKPSMPADKIYLVPDVDGSGKERRQNAAAIMKGAKEMLQKHRPGYANVVLSSASGGTGGVLAAALIKELLDNDQLVIAITVGVADSGAEIKNTLDTLKTFEGIVQTTDKTIAVAYFENNQETPMSKVDDKITELVVAVSVLFSRQNEGLDTRDMYNFLNVNRMTSYKAHAVGLETYAGKLTATDHADTITLASARADKDNSGVDFVIPYTCYGVLPAEISAEISQQAPVHLVTKAYPFNGIAARLRGHLDEMERAAAARTTQSEVLSGKEELAGGFLAL